MTYLLYTLIVLACWLGLGVFGGLFVLLEFKIKKVNLNEKNTAYYFFIAVVWGLVSFVMGLTGLAKIALKK